MSAAGDVEREIEGFRAAWASLRSALGSAVVGHAGPVEQVLTAFFAGGHCLLEGVPDRKSVV